ncbi:hypothetical protein [Pseudomonas amygdali]|uniref:hypothetical protein n=1 Tax=Pseudomonas amygdali TaxID=47877 RepID=UPI002E2B50BE|nr:hypothetical protein [Pseudomonas amygdali]
MKELSVPRVGTVGYFCSASLGNQFTQNNLEIMRGGGAPHPRLSDQAGGRTRFEIHHKNYISKGGAVYDIDNLVIMTPRQHIDHHRSQKNDL